MVLLLAVVGCATGRVAPPRFPLRITEGGLILVRVSAGDHVAGDFVLDTGAGIHVVSAGFLAKLQPTPSGRFSGFRHTGERVDFDTFRVSSLAIGPVRQRAPVVAVWEVLDRLKVEGVLSAKFFETQPVTIDFSRRELIFEDAQSLQARVRRGYTVPLTSIEDRGKSLELFLDVLVGGQARCECKLDTGHAGVAVLDSRYAPALGLAERPNQETQTLLGAKEIRFQAALDVSLASVPSVLARRVEVVFKDHLIYDGLLGTAFWTGHALTLDIPRKRLIISRE